MIKRTQILIIFFLILSNQIKAQCDTNFLYLDFLEIAIEDSTERILSLKFVNVNDTLEFDNPSQIKMIGINKKKECKLIITTNKSEVILDSINEYLSFTETKYKLSIQMPINHSTCIEATFFRPDGLILIHSQTMKTNPLINCVIVDAGPTGYSRFESFESTNLLK